MSESPLSKTHVWMAGISAAIVIVMAAVLFGQVRIIAQQNHSLMIENQKLEIQFDLLKTALDNEGNRIVDKLDAGMPLAISQSSRLNIEEDLEGPIIGALVRQLEDDRPYVKLHGLQGLMAVYPESHRRGIYAPMVVPAVIPTLRDERLRIYAVAVLHQFGHRAEAAAPIVLETADERHWTSLVLSIRNARRMDPQCDYLPLLVRHVQQSEDDWKTTLVHLQHGFTDEEVLQVYQAAGKQTSDEVLRRRYEGIVRYLQDQPPVGSPSSLSEVEDYIQQGKP